LVSPSIHPIAGRVLSSPPWRAASSSDERRNVTHKLEMMQIPLTFLKSSNMLIRQSPNAEDSSDLVCCFKKSPASGNTRECMHFLPRFRTPDHVPFVRSAAFDFISHTDVSKFMASRYLKRCLTNRGQDRSAPASFQGPAVDNPVARKHKPESLKGNGKQTPKSLTIRCHGDIWPAASPMESGSILVRRAPRCAIR
jgi:hypothetical protein